MSKGTKDALEAVGRLLAVVLISLVISILLDVFEGIANFTRWDLTRIVVCYIWARIIVYHKEAV